MTPPVFRFFCSLCLLSAAALTQADTPLSVTLPGGGAYSYWVQSQAGPITVPPETVAQVALVKIDAVAAGDRVFVLDSRTGLLASKLVRAGGIGAFNPVVLTQTDFRPLAAISASPPAAPAPALTGDSAPYAEDAPAAQSDSRDAPDWGRWLGVPAGLILAAGLGWMLASRRRRDLPAAPAASPPTFAPPAAGAVPLAVVAAPAVPLEDGDVPDSVSTDLESTVVTASPARAAGQAVSPRGVRAGPGMALQENAVLVGIQGLPAGSTFALTVGDVTIGRDGENDIVLAESTVSRRHARLLRDKKGLFTVEDLDSSNGIQVNGRPVRYALLRSGDEIKIGDNFFRFQAAEDFPEDETA